MPIAFAPREPLLPAVSAGVGALEQRERERRYQLAVAEEQRRAQQQQMEFASDQQRLAQRQYEYANEPARHQQELQQRLQYEKGRQQQEFTTADQLELSRLEAHRAQVKRMRVDGDIDIPTEQQFLKMLEIPISGLKQQQAYHDTKQEEMQTKKMMDEAKRMAQLEATERQFLSRAGADGAIDFEDPVTGQVHKVQWDGKARKLVPIFKEQGPAKDTSAQDAQKQAEAKQREDDRRRADFERIHKLLTKEGVIKGPDGKPTIGTREPTPEEVMDHIKKRDAALGIATAPADQMPRIQDPAAPPAAPFAAQGPPAAMPSPPFTPAAPPVAMPGINHQPAAPPAPMPTIPRSSAGMSQSAAPPATNQPAPDGPRPPSPADPADQTAQFNALMAKLMGTAAYDPKPMGADDAKELNGRIDNWIGRLPKINPGGHSASLLDSDQHALRRIRDEVLGPALRASRPLTKEEHAQYERLLSRVKDKSLRESFGGY